MLQRFEGEQGVAYMLTIEEEKEMIVEEVKELKKEIKKPLVPTQMEIKAFNKVKELMSKATLTEFEAATLTQLQSFIETSSKARIAQR